MSGNPTISTLVNRPRIANDLDGPPRIMGPQPPSRSMAIVSPGSHYLTPPQPTYDSFDGPIDKKHETVASSLSFERPRPLSRNLHAISDTPSTASDRTPPVSPPENMQHAHLSSGPQLGLFPPLMSHGDRILAPLPDPTQNYTPASQQSLPPIKSILGEELCGGHSTTHRQMLHEVNLGRNRRSSDSSLPRSRWAYWDSSQIQYSDSHLHKPVGTASEPELYFEYGHSPPAKWRHLPEQNGSRESQSAAPSPVRSNAPFAEEAFRDSANTNNSIKRTVKRTQQMVPESEPKKRRRRAPNKQVDENGEAPRKRIDDVDFRQIEDFSPPLETLDAYKEQMSTIWEGGAALNLATDPDRDLLHENEIELASTLRLSCARYLTCKRRIFQARVERLRANKEKFGKTDAQQACNIDVNKASRLWNAFNEVGWFDPKYFVKYRQPENSQVHV